MRNVDSSVFFHPDDERGRARAARDQLAIRICRHCPVIDSCRHHAIAAGERYGVWGGLSEDDRRAIRVY